MVVGLISGGTGGGVVGRKPRVDMGKAQLLFFWWVPLVAIGFCQAMRREPFFVFYANFGFADGFTATHSPEHQNGEAWSLWFSNVLSFLTYCRAFLGGCEEGGEGILFEYNVRKS